MTPELVPVVVVLLRLEHELPLRFHGSPERNEEFLIIAPMGSFNEIFSDIPVWIIAIDIRIKLFQDIVPLSHFPLAPGEEF